MGGLNAGSCGLKQVTDGTDVCVNVLCIVNMAHGKDPFCISLQIHNTLYFYEMQEESNQQKNAPKGGGDKRNNP
jgi:hypothetical protein